jgi:hypothetical protein
MASDSSAPMAKRQRTITLPDFELARRPGSAGEAVPELEILHAYGHRPYEICYSFKSSAEKHAILASPPRKFDAVRPTFTDATNDRDIFSEPTDVLPRRMRRMNVLVFHAGHDLRLVDAWSNIAKAICLLPTEYLNVYLMTPGVFVVVIHKGDNRIMNFPADMTFVRRHALAKNVNNTEAVWTLTRKMLWALQVYPSVCSMYVRPLPEGTSAIVAVVRDMSPEERNMARLAAKVKPAKARDELERALCDAWGTLQDILAPASSNNQDVLYYVLDPRIPRITDYPGFETNGYDSFPLEGEYYDPESKTKVPCTLREILTMPRHPAHYSRRSIVLAGDTRDGKTCLAKVLARRLAFMHQREVPEGQPKFIVVRAVEALKADNMRQHIGSQVPIVFDDITAGHSMPTDIADPADFLKNLLEPVPGTLHCRNNSAYLQAGPRIFTTNTKDMEQWLHPRGADLQEEDLKAILSRLVVFRTTGRLYSAQQNDDGRDDAATEHMLAMSALASGRAHGI